MYILLFLLLIVFLFSFIRKGNRVYDLLVYIYTLSFVLQFLIGRNCPYDTTKTFINLLFIAINIALIFIPWHNVKFQTIVAKKSFVELLRKFLYPILYFNFVINLFIGAIVYIYMPDIANFKANDGYLELYELIPGFSLFFRISFVIQNFGFLAIPIVFYYLNHNETKKAIKAFVLSLSTLIAAFAFYSRALIFSFCISYFAYFLLVRNTVPLKFKEKLTGIVKKWGSLIAVLFLIMTFVRFTAMDYYGERIPKNSFIKNPVLYSLIDYASSCHENGVYCLENYKAENCMNGDYMLMTVKMILNYFHLASWDSEDFREEADKAFSGNYGLFNGYVASTVCDIGYFGTFLLSFFFFIYVNSKTRLRRVTLFDAVILVLLLQIPLNVIFYNYLYTMVFQFLFVIAVATLSKLKI